MAEAGDPGPSDLEVGQGELGVAERLVGGIRALGEGGGRRAPLSRDVRGGQPFRHDCLDSLGVDSLDPHLAADRQGLVGRGEHPTPSDRVGCRRLR
jgi:hypothetical protein